jgi:hypothetical protein
MDFRRMSLAMGTVLMIHLAIGRWILSNEEQDSSSLSNVVNAKFVYANCYAHVVMLITIMLAKFISFPKYSLHIENKLLLL